MSKAEASIVIEAPIDDVFEKTASPETGPVFIPNLNENFNLSTSKREVGQHWQWRYNLFGVDITGTARVVSFEPNRDYLLETDGDARSRWTYSFEPAGNGTRVSLSIDYDMPTGKLANITAAIAERMNQQACEQAMANLKAWIEPE